jgi:hypothetical protein
MKLALSFPLNRESIAVAVAFVEAGVIGRAPTAMESRQPQSARLARVPPFARRKAQPIAADYLKLRS